KKDHFGGLFAKQHIVSALIHGPESAYALGEEIAKLIWAPVMRFGRWQAKGAAASSAITMVPDGSLSTMPAATLPMAVSG
ncbi:phosphogluconate dehydrogenase C-terminal domain-containing protein, partial [Rhizobium ruizarguesonis]